MICPEGTHFQNELLDKEDDNISKITKNTQAEGTIMEPNSFKNIKTWKKSFTNFFRHQRSTRSNDGDRPSGSQEKFNDRELVSVEQKWQSLGKIFRRQSSAEHWKKSFESQAESTSKRFAVRKVFSTYFGKNEKPTVSEK